MKTLNTYIAEAMSPVEFYGSDEFYNWQEIVTRMADEHSRKGTLTASTVERAKKILAALEKLDVQNGSNKRLANELKWRLELYTDPKKYEEWEKSLEDYDDHRS